MEFAQTFRDTILIGTLVVLFIIGYSSKDYHEKIINNIPEKHEINYDYEIDLKPNYIIVYSQNGNVDTIPHGTLEAFFERDNM